MDVRTLSLIGGVMLLLGGTTAVTWALRRRSDTGIDPGIVESLRKRVRAWWILVTALAAAFLIGPRATVFLFWLLSLWAMREFITITPTRPGDHTTLWGVFFLCTPLQFVLVAIKGMYGVYSVLIPVYAMLLIPASIGLSGDPKRFLERTAKIQFGLLICVYCLSFAPALLTLPLKTEDASGGGAERRVALLFFFVLIVQLGDVLQYAWSHLPIRHVIVPAINPTKTWEGLLGGAASASLIGAVLWWATPFPYWMAALASLIIALMGAAGSLTMSAIKRDRGVKDYGTLVEGHGGVLDRIDAMCFAAPVFFHFTMYFAGA